ncbi:hypothetical protein OIO90_003197 [Microbotryomycetes sp. JL221]|nr:hypothetical protein OIO90_003197 [Microbotryomycetes sp. JL221]
MSDITAQHSPDGSSVTRATAAGNEVGPGSHELLDGYLLPDDCYTRDGVYWADLPFRERIKFVNDTTSAETKRELKLIWSDAKQDPAMPIRKYFNTYVMNGMGLFVEGYVLFSIGNLAPLFKSVWKNCWGGTHADCPKELIDSVTYLEIVGIIIGQIAVGIEGDWIGRKFGLVQDALVMLIGVILLMSVWSTSLEAWVAAYTVSLFIYGVGVGGEYPMTSTRALESQIGPKGSRNDRMHRGRNVVLAFLMQGWGQVFNQAVLMICMVIFHDGPNRTEPPYTEKVAQLTYRVSFAVIAVLHAWLAYRRYYHIHDANMDLDKAKKRQNTSGYDLISLRLLCGHYWHRLLATAGGWFATDFFFYGNKIFSGVFIGVIKPGASVFVTWEYNLLNTGVSLVGYYLAAACIDLPWYGRRRMQQIGFAILFLLFLFPAIWFDQLQQAGANIKWFQFMYYLSSFFTQFGPNCTTFLVAAEVYPASIRATAHGFSAAMGKLGALAPTVLYNYIDNHTKFWVVPWFGLLGAVLTAVFLPDTTGLDLREQERYWLCVRQGRADAYHGVAIHPRHLSWYERTVLKRHLNYDPKQDRLDKIDELRVLYESHLIAKADETGEYDDPDHAFISEDVARFFDMERRQGKFEEKKVEQKQKENKLHEQAPDVRMRSRLSEQIEKQ